MEKLFQQTLFTNSFQLLRGSSTSDQSTFKENYLELHQTLLGNLSHQITNIDSIPKVDDPTEQKVESLATQEQPIITGQDIFYNGSSTTQRAIICQNYYKTIVNEGPIKFIPSGSLEEAELVIKTLYKQVFGNAYIMESERLTVVESQLKQGRLTVREFVRRLAKSELYKSRFINNCPRYRSHELNFKHLLGRAPDSYQETSYHSQILDSQGYEADIDSYIDSEEYKQAFGDNIVPYYQGYKSQTGKSLLGYTNMFEMLESLSTSDKASFQGNQSRLQKSLMSNNPINIQPVNVNQPVIDPVKLIRKALKLRFI